MISVYLLRFSLLQYCVFLDYWRCLRIDTLSGPSFGTFYFSLCEDAGYFTRRPLTCIKAFPRRRYPSSWCCIQASRPVGWIQERRSFSIRDALRHGGNGRPPDLLTALYADCCHYTEWRGLGVLKEHGTTNTTAAAQPASHDVLHLSLNVRLLERARVRAELRLQHLLLLAVINSLCARHSASLAGVSHRWDPRAVQRKGRAMRPPSALGLQTACGWCRSEKIAAKRRSAVLIYSRAGHAPSRNKITFGVTSQRLLDASLTNDSMYAIQSWARFNGSLFSGMP